MQRSFLISFVVLPLIKTPWKRPASVILILKKDEWRSVNLNQLSDVETIKQLLEKYDGDFSQIYPKIKQRLVQYQPCELPFPNEFIFFEDDYMRYKLHMVKNRLPYNEIVDIGCQFGFQACLFEDFSYTGIDCWNSGKFFEPERNRYIIGSFPDVEIDLKGKIVISNMSLGYFNNGKAGITDETIAEKLKDAELLYITTTDKLYKVLKRYFKNEELIYMSERVPEHKSYYLSN